MIDKWLKAGVLEAGTLHRTTSGTPQGGVVSPLLANIYLHHVLDRWFVEDVAPRLKGHCTLVRYADDLVAVFTDFLSARRFHAVLGKRLGRFGRRSIRPRRDWWTSGYVAFLGGIRPPPARCSTFSVLPTSGGSR